MKILVTGVAGFIGSHIAEKFVKDGHEVIGVDNFSPYYDRLLKELNVKTIEKAGVKFFERDIVDDDLSELIDGVQYVIHCAAQPGLSKDVPYKEYKRNNVEATKKLLNYFVGPSSLKCFLYTSTSSIYGIKAHEDENSDPKPISDYGRTKLETEKIILESMKKDKLPGVILRIFSVIGPRERPEKLYYKIIKNILKDEVFTLYEGSDEHVRSYTYVGDVVDAVELAIYNLDKSIGEIFNIGGVEAVTTGQGISLVSKILNKQVKIKHIPARKGDQKYTRANIEKAKNILGYEPKTSFREAIEKEIDWYKSKIHKK